MNSILIFDRNFWTWGPQDEGNQFIIPATVFRDRIKSLWIMNDTVWTPWETNHSKLTLSIFLEVLFNSLWKNIMGPIMCPPRRREGPAAQQAGTDRRRPSCFWTFRFIFEFYHLEMGSMKISSMKLCFLTECLRDFRLFSHKFWTI